RAPHQREQPLVHATARLADAEHVQVRGDALAARLDGRHVDLQLALLGRERLLGVLPLLLVRIDGREFPEREVGLDVAGAPGALEALEQLARAGIAAGRGCGLAGAAASEQQQQARHARPAQDAHGRAPGRAVKVLGTRTVNSEPRPGSLSTATLPPCRRTISRTRYSPTPVPPTRRVSPPSTM